MPGFASDHPTYADCLGREKLLLEVANQVTNCRPPQVIGIYGDWGSGKTSFLRSLQLYLEGPPESAEVIDCIKCFDASPTLADVKNPDDWYEGKGISFIRSLPGAEQGGKVVWFEAWRYQGEQAPIIALIHEIRRQFGRGTKFWEMLKKDARIALESSLLALDPIAKAIAQVEPVSGFASSAVGNIHKFAERVERDRYEVPLSSDEIRRHLGEAVKKITDSFERKNIDLDFWKRGADVNKRYYAPNRLTIIVDDLDRCEPEMALRLLEGIKLFFNVDNCVFVLGVNSRRLTDHVAKLYGADDAGENNSLVRHAARDYLDKIINMHYWLGLNREAGTILERHMPTVTCKVNGADHDLKEELQMLIVKYNALPPNPRKVKGFLSTLSRYHGRKFSQTPDASLIIIITYLHQFNPEILRKILYHDGYGPQFQAWCRTGGTSGPDETKVLKSLVTKLNDTSALADETFPDPIYDQVLLIQNLIKDWPKQLVPSIINSEPYSLFG